MSATFNYLQGQERLDKASPTHSFSTLTRLNARKIKCMNFYLELYSNFPLELQAKRGASQI